MAKLKRLIPLLVGVLVLIAVVGCQSGSQRSLQQKIRKYLYDNQPTTSTEFLVFASKELSDYSSRDILKALLAEGEHQAGLGHPSAVGVLSHFASGYAKTKGLSYDADSWLELQQEALKKNTLKESPSSLWK